MKKVIKITESQLKKLIIEQNLNEFHDDYNELDSLFDGNFNTEDDYGGGSPVKNNEMPLHKYIEKKKMNSLDEDEDITMLDNLFKKD